MRSSVLRKYALWVIGLGCVTLGVSCGAEEDLDTPCGPGETLVGQACVNIGGDEADTSVSPDADAEPPETTPSGQAALLPLAVDTFWAPSGYMGDGIQPGNVNPIPCAQRAPNPAGDCHGFEYGAGTVGWAGVLWQHPENNWGDYPGKAVVPGATYLNAVAWVESGSHSVTFQSGSDLDTFSGSVTATLTPVPQRVWIPLDNATYSEMVVSFGWTADKADSDALRLYIDDIRLENGPWELTGSSCEDIPCLNGGECDDSGGSITCDCDAISFEGPLCESVSYDLPITIADHFVPTGYTGDGATPGVVNDDDACPIDPGELEGNCHRFSYLGGVSFAGIVWQHPADNWGDAPGFPMPEGAKAVSFWAWGETGDELVEFKAGLGDIDGFSQSSGTVPLTTTPTRYVIDLSDVTYGEVVGGFSWSAEAPADGGDLVFYLDDIQWLAEPPESYSTAPTVTFKVDMSCSGVESYEGVYVYGTFNDWCVDCHPLQREGESETWIGKLPFWVSGEIEYKYHVDGAAEEEDLIDDVLAGGTCAPVTDFESHANRTILTPADGNITLEDIFGRCLPCGEPLCEPTCAESNPCGDNGCGVSCGTCDVGLLCTLGQCVEPCEPSCAEVNPCGDDGCGGSCGECTLDNATCSPEGQCVCTPSCEGKACGDDGCGGECGACGDGEFCNEGLCGIICEPSCAETNPCGDDGCGGSCGSCDEALICEDGQCVAPCAPQCTDKACGDDGCGGSCGSCDEGDLCNQGQCITPCVPQCAESGACGDDGCGNSCGACAEDQVCESGQCVAAAPTFDVTFQVDMSCSGLSTIEAVFVVGPWEQWSSDGHPLSDEDGDGVWTATYSFEPGQQVEYKYQVDGWADEEDLLDDMLTGFSCAPVTNYFSYANRKVIVSEDMVLNDTYGSCKGCDDPMPPGVTFQVDMSCSDFTIGYVAVTGPFSNWCGNCNKLSDNDGDGVYQGTFLFDAGTVLEYKYQVDNWTHEENLVDDMVSGATCAPSTDYDSYANRQVTVVDGPPVVVSDTFDSCSTCP